MNDPIIFGSYSVPLIVGNCQMGTTSLRDQNVTRGLGTSQTTWRLFSFASHALAQLASVIFWEDPTPSLTALQLTLETSTFRAQSFIQALCVLRQHRRPWSSVQVLSHLVGGSGSKPRISLGRQPPRPRFTASAALLRRPQEHL